MAKVPKYWGWQTNSWESNCHKHLLNSSFGHFTRHAVYPDSKSLEEFWQIIEYIEVHFTRCPFRCYDTICRRWPTGLLTSITAAHDRLFVLRYEFKRKESCCQNAKGNRSTSCFQPAKEMGEETARERPFHRHLW